MNDFIDGAFVFLRMFALALEIALNKPYFSFVFQSFKGPTHSTQYTRPDILNKIVHVQPTPYTHKGTEKKWCINCIFLSSMLSFFRFTLCKMVYLVTKDCLNRRINTDTQSTYTNCSGSVQRSFEASNATYVIPHKPKWTRLQLNRRRRKVFKRISIVKYVADRGTIETSSSRASFNLPFCSDYELQSGRKILHEFALLWEWVSYWFNTTKL